MKSKGQDAGKEKVVKESLEIAHEIRTAKRHWTWPRFPFRWRPRRWRRWKKKLEDRWELTSDIWCQIEQYWIKDRFTTVTVFAICRMLFALALVSIVIACGYYAFYSSKAHNRTSQEQTLSVDLRQQNDGTTQLQDGQR